MSDKQQITWWVPRWAFVSRQWRTLRQCILNRRSFTAVVFGSVISCATIIVACKLAFPAMVVPNLWPVAIAVPGFFVALVLQTAVLTLIPPYVRLRPNRLEKSHGQTGLQIKAADVLRTQLYVHRGDRVRLRIRYNGRKRTRTLVLGVPTTVDLDRLVEMLPVRPSILDARSRLISLQHRS